MLLQQRQRPPLQVMGEQFRKQLRKSKAPDNWEAMVRGFFGFKAFSGFKVFETPGL
jgi:hypothetical protein